MDPLKNTKNTLNLEKQFWLPLGSVVGFYGGWGLCGGVGFGGGVGFDDGEVRWGRVVVRLGGGFIIERGRDKKRIVCVLCNVRLNFQ